ncbi:MAG: hypothetical protein R6V72_11105 [Cyclobacterium sp.]
MRLKEIEGKEIEGERLRGIGIWRAAFDTARGTDGECRISFFQEGGFGQVCGDKSPIPNLG